MHLTTGVSYLGDDDLLVAGELAESYAFVSFDRLRVLPREESFATCIRVNDRVIFPTEYEGAKARIFARGYEIMELEWPEFRKWDGGLSCPSLRLP